MSREEHLAEMRAKKAREMESFMSCVKMFLENRKMCGVESDAAFIAWITGNIKEREVKLKKMFKEHEKLFPD